MDHELLKRALRTQGGIKCSDDAVLAQLATAADGHGYAAKDLAAKLGAWLMNG
jgi:hypothetical protein